MDREREVDELRHIVEKVEDKKGIGSDDGDVAILKEILERKISELQTEINLEK